MTDQLRVTVWNEFKVEQENEESRSIYPDGMHTVIANHLSAQGFMTRTATFHEPAHGLTQDVLDNTDVLLWWGHWLHKEVSDDVVDRVQKRVLDGMGLIVLHSGHESKIFMRLMGTSCDLKWREAGERERLWVVEPAHPIVAGLNHYIELPQTEMYGEPFRVPTPDVTVFISWFEGGEVFRSGCCYQRENGKIFYFRPGHETFPIYHNPEVMQVITNAVRWAAPTAGANMPAERHYKTPLEATGKRQVES